jgi:hypothetical protein
MGAGLALAPLAGAQTVRQGRWLRLETANFVVYSAASEARTREEIAAVEGFHALLSKIIPRKQPSTLKLPIYMTGNDEDFRDVAPWADRDVMGFVHYSAEQILAVSSLHKNVERQRDMQKNVRAMDARTVLLHEYAHHYIMANNRVTYPSWYNEGIAEFLSTADFVEDGVLVGKFTAARATWLANAPWLNITIFLTANPNELSNEKQGQFYAQAWLAAHYLFQAPERAEGFDRYITALHDGADPMAAFEPAFGITAQAFDKELRDYKNKPLKFGKVAGITANASIEMKGERLPVAADNLLMPLANVSCARPTRYAMGSVAAIRNQPRKLEADPFAIRARATAEIWYGDLGEARKLLDRLLVTDTQNAETQHLSGLCDLRAAYRTKDAALFKKARGAFASAQKIDATRANSLFRYVECGVQEAGGRFDDHFADVAFMTYRLAPQVDGYAQALALALIQQKRFADAVLVLRPQIADSHDSNKALPQALMEAAKAEKEPAFFWPESAAAIDETDD